MTSATDMADAFARLRHENELPTPEVARRDVPLAVIHGVQEAVGKLARTP